MKLTVFLPFVSLVNGSFECLDVQASEYECMSVWTSEVRVYECMAGLAWRRASGLDPCYECVDVQTYEYECMDVSGPSV